MAMSRSRRSRIADAETDAKARWRAFLDRTDAMVVADGDALELSPLTSRPNPFTDVTAAPRW